MLTQRSDSVASFTRRDATRLGVAAAVLVLVLTTILGSDILPRGLALEVGDPAPRTIVAPRAQEFISEAQTAAAREAARSAVGPQYDFTTEKAITLAAEQQRAFERRVAAIDAAFTGDTTPEDRAAILQNVIPDLPDSVRGTLTTLPRGRWATIRTEAARVLDATLRAELRDTAAAEVRARLPGQMAGGLDERFVQRAPDRAGARSCRGRRAAGPGPGRPRRGPRP
jgi:membrane-associated HD superfamily phosphohydrolase